VGGDTPLVGRLVVWSGYVVTVLLVTWMGVVAKVHNGCGECRWLVDGDDSGRPTAGFNSTPILPCSTSCSISGTRYRNVLANVVRHVNVGEAWSLRGSRPTRTRRYEVVFPGLGAPSSTKSYTPAFCCLFHQVFDAFQGTQSPQKQAPSAV
jgi:hypothetical protein